MQKVSEMRYEYLFRLALELQQSTSPKMLLTAFAKAFVEDLPVSACIILQKSPDLSPVFCIEEIYPSDYEFDLSAVEVAVLGFVSVSQVGDLLKIEENLYVLNAGLTGTVLLVSDGKGKLPEAASQTQILQSIAESYRKLVALEALKNENQRLILATRAGGIGTWELDTVTHDLYWDEQMFRLYEVDKDSFQGNYKFFEQHVDPEDAVVVWETIQTYLEKFSDGPVEYQFRIVTPAGRTKKLAGYASVKHVPGTNPRLIGINYDITQIETARTQSIYRSQLENLLINLSIKVIRSGPEDLDDVTNEALEVVGRFVGADRAYRFSYDFQSEIEVASNTHEWCNDGILPEIDNLQNVPVTDIEVFVTSHQRGLPVNVFRVFDLPESHGLRLILEPQGVRSLITIPLMEVGKCIGFIGFDSVKQERHWSDVDVNLLKLLADLLVNAEIKARHELTIQETQKALVESRDTARYLAKEAVTANVAKTRFVASVSHEIRTPLHAIIGIADLTLKETDNPVLADHIRSIRLAGSTLLDLINDVLEFSRAESNDVRVKQAEFSIEHLVNNLAKIFKPLAEAKNLAFNINVQPLAHNNFVGDQLRIQQVLSNLIGNAIKFTQLGGVTLNILNISPRTENGAKSVLTTLAFQVIDTGVGISRGDRDKLFDPFFQSEDAVRGQIGGTGLGLAISHLLASKMGGVIKVESEKHRGSVFTFELSLCPAEKSADERSDQDIQFDDFELKGVRVLLAEDNPVNQQLVRAYLRETGCELDIAADGEKALEAYQSSHYHIILMDCRMPNLDGYDTAKIIRLQESTYQHIPILAVTASAMDDDRETCLQAGMDDVLTKPFTRNDLIRMIKKWL